MRVNSKGMSGHHSAKMKNDEWLTPKWIIDSLGEFDLDPCSPGDRLTKDIIHYRNQSNKWEYLYKNFCNVENDAKEKPSTTNWVNMGGGK